MKFTFEKLKISDSPHDRTIYFDDTCNLCIRSVDVIRKFDRKHSFNYLPLRYSIFNSEQNNSIVYSENGKIYEKSDAVLKIVKKLNAPVSWLYILKAIPRTLRDKIYEFISKNRYGWFGQCETCTKVD